MDRHELRVLDDRLAVGGVELAPLVPRLELVDRSALRGGELLGPLHDLGPQGVGELVEQRRDRVGLVEELAPVSDGGDRRRRPSLADGEAVGVAEQALELVPTRPRASRAAGRPLASARGRRSSRSWSSATARNRWLPPRARRASRWSVSGASGSGGGPPARPARSFSRWSSAGDLGALLPGLVGDAGGGRAAPSRRVAG